MTSHTGSECRECDIGACADYLCPPGERSEALSDISQIDQLKVGNHAGLRGEIMGDLGGNYGGLWEVVNSRR